MVILRCTHCKRYYSDSESIESARKIRADDTEDGGCPCPILICPGEMIEEEVEVRSQF